MDPRESCPLGSRKARLCGSLHRPHTKPKSPKAVAGFPGAAVTARSQPVRVLPAPPVGSENHVTGRQWGQPRVTPWLSHQPQPRQSGRYPSSASPLGGNFSPPRASRTELRALIRTSRSEQPWRGPDDRSDRPDPEHSSMWGHPAPPALTAPLRRFRDQQVVFAAKARAWQVGGRPQASRA